MNHTEKFELGRKMAKDAWALMDGLEHKTKAAFFMSIFDNLYQEAKELPDPRMAQLKEVIKAYVRILVNDGNVDRGG